MEAKAALRTIAEQMGPGIFDLSFELQWKPSDPVITSKHFQLYADHDNNDRILISGEYEGISVIWTLTYANRGYWMDLSIHCDQGIPAALEVAFKLHYESDLPIRINRGDSESGSHRESLFHTFQNSKSAGLFLGIRIPKTFVHEYQWRKLDEHLISVRIATKFTEGIRYRHSVKSESVWVSAGPEIKTALSAYASHVPLLDQPKTPPVGWNSWDYYFRTVSLHDMMENMDHIRKDEFLAKHVQYIVLDDGWEATEGEWHPNYRFPGGTQRLAQEITNRGFVPGIWTAPLLVEHLSLTALRSHEMLIKNDNGDPLLSEVPQKYLLDPTHPRAKQFLKEIYTRLYQEGFRLFKIDFVSCLLAAKRFHDPHAGPYDALRELFAIIRECVTNESHLLGCSLPAECGPGLADSGRIGIDIHNHWTHVEWVCETLQWRYWMHNRIWTNDADFLIVRGLETSLEQETNVLNPEANNPHPPRWRSGPVFTQTEAETWGNIVAMSGGSVFLGDRIGQLNKHGRALLKQSLLPRDIAAEPLDLCDRDIASLWLQRLPDVYILTLINWSDEREEISFGFHDYGLSLPEQVYNKWTGSSLSIKSGDILVSLNPHESAVITWDKGEVTLA